MVITKLSRLRRYELAREARSAILEDEILSIADTPQYGTILKQTPKGIVAIQAEMIEHRKLQVETRKWILAHLNANRWGDKKIIAGSEEEPIQLVVKHIGGKE